MRVTIISLLFKSCPVLTRIGLFYVMPVGFLACTRVYANALLYYVSLSLISRLESAGSTE